MPQFLKVRLRAHSLESRKPEPRMIDSLPPERARALDWQWPLLQDCPPTHPVFPDDFWKLSTPQSDCCWVAETVGGKANRTYPMFPGPLNCHHWGFDEPALATGSQEETLTVSRRVRNEICRAFIADAKGHHDPLKARNKPNHPLL